MYREFSKVPWVQRDTTQRNAVALGLLVALLSFMGGFWKWPPSLITALGWAWPAALIWVSFWCAKGPVFYKDRWNADGTLQKWSRGYCIFAWLFTIFVVIGRIAHWYGSTIDTEPFIEPIF